MKIIGICLIKNEDLYIERVLLNVVDFCDEIIVLDNMSTDNTYQEVEKFARNHPKIKLQRIQDYKTSHSYVSPYAGAQIWLFRVDGDEIYDPSGLQKLRSKILSGEYQQYWRIEGNSLNCVGLNLKNSTAAGYLSPPSKPAPLMYNFSMLQSWIEDRSERLHGKNMVFKEGFSKNDRLLLFEKYTWEESFFRCLHICFLKRSSFEPEKSAARLNPNESSLFFSKTINLLRNMLKMRFSLESSYKLDRYRKGDLCTKKINAFID
jgi:glycosyltransferase involved in cell wall biosynthesis